MAETVARLLRELPWNADTTASVLTRSESVSVLRVCVGGSVLAARELELVPSPPPAAAEAVGEEGEAVKPLNPRLCPPLAPPCQERSSGGVAAWQQVLSCQYLYFLY